MNVKTKKKVYFFIVLLLVSVFGIQIFGRPASHLSTAQSTTQKSQEELDRLNKELKETQAKLDEVKKQKEDIKKQLANSSQQQNQLANDTKRLEATITSNELQEKALVLELDSLELEVQIVKEEKAQIEAKLVEMQGQIVELQKEYQMSLNLLYKLAFNNPSLLDESTSFEDSVVFSEETKSIVKVVKLKMDEITTLKAQAKAKQAEVAQKEAELLTLQESKEVQKINLGLQRTALEFQKNNKKTLLEETKKNQENLSEQQKVVDQQIKAYEAQLNNLKNSLYSAPPSGSPVVAGQVIGFQGRTGWVCAYKSDAQIAKIPPADYSNKYCGKPYYYFYDIEKYPYEGTHLHFSYRKNGALVYPQTYLQDKNSKEFDRMPMDNFTITQGYHQGGAIDLQSAYGAPIYAIKPGKIQYYCDAFEYSPAYGAIIYHTDGTASQYWHMQKRADSPPCSKL